MGLNVDDIIPYVYDPEAVQQLILQNMGNYEIMDPTNPFTMLLEAATTMASAASIETIAALKRRHASLATDIEDLLPYVADKNLADIFSNPAQTWIVFYLSIRDLKTNGFRMESGGYVETIIPADTVVEITGIKFTLLNDIHVKLYDNGVVFAEQQLSSDIAANNSLGILSAGIINFQDGEPWLAVETTVKQLNKNTIIKPVTASEGFKLRVKHTDKYYYSEVFFKDGTTNGQWVKIDITHSNTYINPDVPTARIAVMDNLVEYEIPDVYLLSGQVGGEIKVVLYETRGELNLPISKYQMSEYLVKLNTVTTDPIKATIANIKVNANSRDIVSGGTSKLGFADLKKSVIYNTLGHDVLPVTTEQLTRKANVNGFELYNLINLITSRVYIAARNIDRIDSKLVYARPDLFFNSVNVHIPDINNTKILIEDNYVLIPSGTVFREDNGIMSIVSDADLAMVEGLSNTALMSYLSNNRMFFTPYYYIIDTTDTSIIDTRVYDLDNPDLYDIRITGKNINMLERVNIGKYGLVRTETGYDFIIEILSNSEFENTNFNLLRGQLSIDMFDGQSTIHFEGTYDAATKLMTFPITTNFNLTGENKLEITNGVADISNTFIDLLTTGTVYLFSTDGNLTDNSNFLRDKIAFNYADIVVFDREVLTIEFGRSVDYIWNKMFTTYTERKYLKHLTDIPLVYKEDVYEMDELGSIILTTPDGQGGYTTSTNKLHSIGDPVLDPVTSDPMYEALAGDIVLDENMLPTIDIVAGVNRHVDIFMLEYEYLAANSTVYVNYLENVRSTINGWLFGTLPEINNSVIDNTKVLYRSYKKAAPVDITTESASAAIPYSVRPTVIIYGTRDDYSSIELANLKTDIGYIIHKYLDAKDINISDLKKEIIDSSDDTIISVRISGIDSFANSEIFRVTDPTSRLAFKKVMDFNANNELTVNYDIDLKIHKV